MHCVPRLARLARGALGGPKRGETQMKKQNGLAEVSGTRLYYEVAGSEHPMVLIHGFTVDTRMWDDQFETFAQHYQVIRYDVRGFGKSDLPTGESYSYADDLRTLIEHLGISHAYVLGLSMGGMIAIDFALEYPGATDALIPADAALGGFQWQEFGESLASVWSRARESGIQAAKELWLGLDLFEPAMKKPDVASRLTQMISDYSGWHFGEDDPFPGLDPPAMQRLAEISAPTLSIVGEYDLSDFHTIAGVLQEQIPEARKVVLPGVGHMSNMEDPSRFNEIVLNFLADL
jgi:pimeloyl-ACP methyl ester carboxylesterase